MKHVSIFAFAFTLMSVCFVFNLHAQFPGGGSGTKENPYKIETISDLVKIRDAPMAQVHYILMNDIDFRSNLHGEGWEPIGSDRNNPFKGQFNGNNHKIIGLWLDRSSYGFGDGIYLGLFGYLNQATIENLTIIVAEEGSVKGNSVSQGGVSIGILFGSCENHSIIYNCHTKGTVITNGWLAGGLAGQCSESEITQCSTDANVQGISSGGLIARSNASVITSCYSSGSVTGSVGGDIYCGGLIGYAGDNTVIDSSYSISNVTATEDTKDRFSCVGGLVGSSTESSMIKNSYAKNSVSGKDNVGGLVGYNTGLVKNSYFIGDVSGINNVGGLIGLVECEIVYSGTVVQCHSSGNVTGNENVGGLIGFCCGGKVYQNYSVSNIFGNNNVGGLIGVSDKSYSYSRNFPSSVIHCYSKGDVTGKDENATIGGLIGLCFKASKIEDSYSASQIFTENESAFTGGLIGQYEEGFTISECYYDKETSNQLDENKGIGKSTSEMMNQTTFSAWNFSNIWSINDRIDYPQLRWQTGEGLDAHPFLVGNVEELNAIRCNLYASYKLNQDIDLVDYLDNERSEDGWESIGFEEPFSGTLDGDGYKISGLWMERIGFSTYAGFFARTYYACVKNVNIEIKHDQAINVKGEYESIGGLIGHSFLSKIDSCSVSGNVKGRYIIGGLIGNNQKSFVSNCFFKGNIEGYPAIYLGGLIGDNITNDTDTWRCGVYQCAAEGSIKNGQNIGGLIGRNATPVNQCYAKMQLSGGEYMGGLIGLNSGTYRSDTQCVGVVSESYSLSNIVGDIWNGYASGGLIGLNGSDVVQCYSAGNILKNSGGLIGRNGPNGSHVIKITESYFDTETSQTELGVADGQKSEIAGKTTAQMKKSSTFQNWNFNNVWKIDEDSSYPYFIWQKNSDTSDLDKIGASKNIIQVYPNPTAGVIYIDCEVNTPIQIYSIFGHLLMQSISQTEKGKVDLSGYSNGIYLIKIGREYARVIKK